MPTNTAKYCWNIYARLLVLDIVGSIRHEAVQTSCMSVASGLNNRLNDQLGATVSYACKKLAIYGAQKITCRPAATCTQIEYRISVA